MSRIPNHKEVKFMKKFNFSKGLVIGLLTLALCLTCFAAAKVSADDAKPTKTTGASGITYNATTDEISCSANSGESYVYVLKQESGTKLKKGQSATAQMSEGKIKASDLTKKTNADLYLYICDKIVEIDEGETVNANFVIKGNANKVVVTVDYTQADVDASVSVLSATVTDKSKKTTTASDLLWSADGSTWYDANELATTGGRKDDDDNPVSDGFTGKDLNNMLAAGGTIFVKEAGKDGVSKTAAFGSKAVKVKIVKQAAAPKVKVDVSKDTIAIKNGFDFALAQKSQGSEEYDRLGAWYTVLPLLKTAAVSDDKSIVSSATNQIYKPLSKKDSNAGKEVAGTGNNASNKYYSYTKTAYKAFSINDLFTKLGIDGSQADFRIAVRKSATEKKPASAVALIELGYQAEAPVVYTKDNVKNEYLVATTEDFAKKGFTLGEIVAFPGYTEPTSSTKAIATEGFDETFAIKEASEAIKGADDGSSFEYLVVSTADYKATGKNAIDWTTVKWKKFDPSKLKITEKLAGAYSLINGTKKKVNLKTTSSANIGATPANVGPDAYGRSVILEAHIKSDTKTLILIRRAGDKASNKRASKTIALYVAKEGKAYNLYSTVSNGDVAYKLTVNFAKYSKDANGFNVDSKINTVSKWFAKSATAQTLYLELPEIENAEYYADDTAEGVQLASTPVALAKGSGDNASKYGFTIAADGETQTQTAIIREYANIKVAVKTQVDDKTAVNYEDKAVTVAGGKVGSSNDVTCWVGSACNIVITPPATPAASDDAHQVAAAQPAYTISTGSTYAEATKTITVTPTSAKEVSITITFKYAETPKS